MLAIIPAKKHSTRISNKNIKLLNSKPLLSYSISAALNSKFVTRVIVSTDCPEIALISKKFGAEVPFLRPKKLTADSSGMKDICRHALIFLEQNEKIIINNIVGLQPTSPLRSAKDIDLAIKLFIKKKAESVMSFNSTKPIEWHKYIKNNKNFYSIIKNNKKKKLKESFVLNGAIYIYNRSYLFSNKDYITNDKKSFAYLMPKERSVDIDEQIDFDLAEFLIKKKNL